MTTKTKSEARFNWSDPLLLDQQLTGDERMVRDSARAYCQDKLAPRVLEAFRHERTDVAIFRELGQLDMLGIVIPEAYGGVPDSAMSATASWRAKWSASTPASDR